MNKLLLALATLIVLLHCQSPRPERLTGSLGDSAMVVSAHPIATKIGVQVLKEGGNSIDAAVAVQFALAVVYPRAGNIGGGGFAVLRLTDGATAALDFREKAPKKATRDMYLDSTGNVISDRSTLGHLAAGVPGSVAGFWELHQTYGSLPWERLIAPAIVIAKEGFAITQNEADALNEKQADFIKANGYVPWVVKEEGWKAGDVVAQPDLVFTLEQIRDFGNLGFYVGQVADSLIAEMTRGGGIISKEDLETYKPLWRKPITGTYKGLTIITMPPPSCGVTLLQVLKGFEQFEIASDDYQSSTHIHLMAEVERRAFADRATHLGDPDFHPVPLDRLLDSTYILTRVSDINPEKASLSSEITSGTFPLTESDETTHFSIVDPFGNAISITTTLNGNYGSKVWVRGAGFVLNNEMDDFSAKPGSPNMFGLVGGEANAIVPEKRMLSSMTPSILEKNGELFMIVGSPGGSKIITSVFQVISNVVDFDMTMQEAVNQKRVHHQWLPDRILMEQDGFPEARVSELQDMGHKIEFEAKMSRTDCILVRPDGTYEGGADNTRGDDYAEGF